MRGAAIEPGQRVLVLGSGTIGLLAAQFALAAGAEVHVGGVREGSLELARVAGRAAHRAARRVDGSQPDSFDAVIECTSNETMPALAVRLVKPAGRVVFIGLSSAPSLVDTRDIALRTSRRSACCRGRAARRERSRRSPAAPSCPMRSSARSSRSRRCPSRFEGHRGAGRRSGTQGARRSEAAVNPSVFDPDAAERLVGADRVIAVLTELADHPTGVTLDELAGILNSPKPTVHRALATLRRAGLADLVERGVYVLGDEYLRLAFRNLDGRPETARVQPLLEELAAQYGETAHYAVLAGTDIVYRAKMDPPQGAVRLTSVIGGRNPAYRTAVGKALLAPRCPIELDVVRRSRSSEDAEHVRHARARCSPSSRRPGARLRRRRSRERGRRELRRDPGASRRCGDPERSRSASARSPSAARSRDWWMRCPRSARRSVGT